jgi:dipeptidyl-peptidase-4
MLFATSSLAQVPLKRLTLEALFEEKALEVERFADPMWLPDGEHVLYWTSRGTEGSLWRHDVNTGETDKVVDRKVMMDGLAAQRPEWKKTLVGDVNSSASHRGTPVLSPDGAVIVGGHAGDLYLLDLGTGTTRFLTNDPAPESYPAFSSDGSKLAFVRDGDLYWLEVETGEEHRVTDRGDNRYLLNGLADWVYEEELGVERSFWWSPQGDRLAFMQFDERPVGIVPITDDDAPYPGLEKQWYPKAGTANPIVRVGVVGLKGGDPLWLETGEGDYYLPRAGWTPQGKVWVQKLNRDQTVHDLMVGDPTSGEVRILVTDTDAAWINIRDDLQWLSDGRFLWTSERDGWRHLYLYGADGTLERRLTRGEWQIEKVVGVDPEEEHAFIVRTGDDPRHRLPYRVDLSTGNLEPLGHATRGVHEASLGPRGEHLVDHWSTRDTPPRADLLTSDGKTVRRIWGSGTILADWDLLPVEAGSIVADDGTELHSLLFRPRDFDISKRYPVVHYVYGGPHSQLTADRWGGSIHMTYRLLAEMGIAVFLVDNRGTWGRGHAFETVIHRRLGEMEVKDQLVAARWLKARSWVDPDRIAVYGGSYGGYMTLLLMFQGTDVYRAGIAYAPVTDWRLYDTIYTERYMDTPQDNPDGYSQSAPLTHATSLSGSLLLAHGTMDNNVHFQQTLQLVGKLAAADKSFELVVYPRTRHGVRRSQFALHFHRLKVDFLRRNLLENSGE